jgi:hypothetical protein
VQSLYHHTHRAAGLSKGRDPAGSGGGAVWEQFWNAATAIGELFSQMWVVFWNAAAAIGTLLAVAVALFKDQIKRWWRPQINVTPSIARFMVFTGPTTPYMAHAYLRFKVAVGDGRGGARQVQAHILHCSPSPTVGDSEPIPEAEILIPVPWSFTDNLVADIPAGSARYVDIAESRADARNMTRLSTVRTPPEARHILQPGEVPYRITVLLSGDNIAPVFYEVSVRVLGGWDGTAENLHASLNIASAGISRERRPETASVA